MKFSFELVYKACYFVLKTICFEIQQKYLNNAYIVRVKTYSNSTHEAETYRNNIKECVLKFLKVLGSIRVFLELDQNIYKNAPHVFQGTVKIVQFYCFKLYMYIEIL